MPVRKLSQLPAAAALTGTETLPLVQAGATVAATAGSVAALYGPRNTLNAATDPGPADDAGQGYAVGSAWFNTATGVTWRCRDASPGAAQWVQPGLPGHGHPIAEVTGLQAALDALGARPDTAGLRNAVTNGCCRVSHRAAKALSGSWQSGEVDLIAVRADGTPGAGQIRRAAGVSALSPSGYACQVQGTTLGEGGAVWWRHRIEAADAARFQGGPAVLGARFWHDTGAAVDVTVTLNRADAADDFSAVTAIASGTTAVADAVNADLTLAVADMGACQTGIEILIRAACGAVTARSFYLGALQLEPGTVRTAFERRPLALETALVHRYLRPCAGLVGKANSGSNMQIVLAHPGLRAAPGYEVTGALEFTDCVTADFTQSQPDLNTVHERDRDKGRVSCGYFSGLSSGTVLVQRGSGGTILASAEL